jgi:hypothetical protein
MVPKGKGEGGQVKQYNSMVIFQADIEQARKMK